MDFTIATLDAYSQSTGIERNWWYIVKERKWDMYFWNQLNRLKFVHYGVNLHHPSSYGRGKSAPNKRWLAQ